METRNRVWLAAVLDVALIVAFAVIGRSSHGEALAPLGLWTTTYPFLAGWAVAVLVSRAWRRPLAVWPTGVVAWLLTVVVGMVLRVATGQGVAVSFVIVATIVLGVFLVGWRLVAALVLRVTRAGRRRPTGVVR
jgi:hypothetical protein